MMFKIKIIKIKRKNKFLGLLFDNGGSEKFEFHKFDERTKKYHIKYEWEDYDCLSSPLWTEKDIDNNIESERWKVIKYNSYV